MRKIGSASRKNFGSVAARSAFFSRKKVELSRLSENTIEHEFEALKARLENAEDALRAIRSGEVDAVVETDLAESRVFSLEGTDKVYRLLIETMGDGAVTLSPAGLILFCNRRFSEILHVPLEKIPGKGITEFIHDSDRDKIELLLRKASVRPEHVEVTITGSDGTKTPVQISISYLEEGIPEPVYCLVVTDISEQKRALEWTLNALARERELNEMKKCFVYMISHEFKTPLAAMLFALDFLTANKGDVSTEKRDRKMYLIRQSINQMTSMIDNVLTHSRVEAGMLSFNPKPVIINDWLVQFVENQKAYYQKHNVCCIVDNSLAREYLLDQDLLRQVLVNLINNAVKYSPESDKVDFKVGLEGNSIVFEVTDYGIGVPKSEACKLFEVFYRGSNVGNLRGTGLGLTIVKHMVERMGGKISVESEEGEGSTFRVVLPIINSR
ncbi:MAG: PAS domain-containing sensor histidine kinase [Candidatus Riflebacteria bacterium]|nr:PAS domain-containing sensor histidine kinase [Candidatus Riflebacteria bacterium]